MSKPVNLVIGIYFHPEAFPPTLNAVGALSGCFDSISIVHRNHLRSEWAYPENVVLVPSGSRISVLDQQVAPLTKKVRFFAGFTADLFRELKKSRPQLVLLYDSMSLYAYHLIRRFLKFPHKVWYHNHDVTEPDRLRKYSVGWLAFKAEAKAFRYLDIFSLPANERMKYFPLTTFKGKYFFIPNYPSLKFYSRFAKAKSPATVIKLIFQGQVAPFRGIEQVIQLLDRLIDGKTLELSIAGPCSESYRSVLDQLISKHKVEDKVTFSRFPYSELPAYTSQHHIGLGILADSGIMHATVGTASNKLYEYAALGLPVLYLDSPVFTSIMSAYTWAFPVKIDPEDIFAALTHIASTYESFSEAAYQAFIQRLNFEYAIGEVKNYICQPELTSI